MSPPIQSDRLTIPEIACRLNIGRLAVYAMLEKGAASWSARRAAVDCDPPCL